MIPTLIEKLFSIIVPSSHNNTWEYLSQSVDLADLDHRMKTLAYRGVM